MKKGDADASCKKRDRSPQEKYRKKIQDELVEMNKKRTGRKKRICQSMVVANQLMVELVTQTPA